QDIRRTVSSFRAFYYDDPKAGGTGGFFSHIDPTTMRYDSTSLGDRASQKNWNSVGDHIPAYLINVILALEPLPEGRAAEMRGFLEDCKSMLRELTDLILAHFPSNAAQPAEEPSPFVNERFGADWQPDH